MAKGIARDQTVSPVKKTLSRSFRREMTPAERKLWSLLRGKGANGRKFRRQQVIDGFIVDFYCPILSLVIEADGEIHRATQEYDRERDEALRSRGLTVVRFTNDAILEKTDEVVRKLSELTSV